MTATAAAEGSTASPGPPPGGGAPPRRRIVAWVSVGVALAAAVLVAVLATSGPVRQISVHSPLVGKPAPPVTGPDLLAPAGPPATAGLNGAPGHWVLVNFAASWCVPCRQEMPQLLLWASRHALRGDASVITVAYDEGDRQSLAAYLRARKVVWPLIDDNAVKVAYGVTGIPESYLVDPQGRVVTKIVAGVNADRLDALMAPFGPAGSGG